MRFVWLLLLLLVPPADASAFGYPAAITLAPDSEGRWVPFDLTPGNQIRFTMRLNGEPATAILDTGVSISVASRRFARSIGLEAVSTGRADAIGGTIPITWAATEKLAIGGLTREGGRVAIVDLAAVATGSTEPVDLLIGSDLLSCCALDIDYAAHRFRLLPSGRVPFRGASAPLSIGRDTRVYISEVTLGGRKVRPIIVDTGDGSAVTLSQSAWSATGVEPGSVTSAIAYGLGGAIETDVTIVPRLRIGTQQASQVEVRIEDRNGFSDLTGTAGRIGSGLLQRYRVLMDPKAGHMVLQPGPKADAPPVRSTSGLLVGHDKGRLRVLHVMRGGPAEAAGWEEGELICTIDGAPVPPADDGGVETRWSAGKPGRVVRFGMCDGDRRALTLRHFY